MYRGDLKRGAGEGGGGGGADLEPEVERNVCSDNEEILKCLHI